MTHGIQRSGKTCWKVCPAEKKHISGISGRVSWLAGYKGSWSLSGFSIGMDQDLRLNIGHSRIRIMFCLFLIVTYLGYLPSRTLPETQANRLVFEEWGSKP